MALATEVVWHEAQAALLGMADPEGVKAALVSAMAMYMMLWVLPEPISKGVAAALTAGLIAYLGVDLVWGLMTGWLQLVDDVDGATTFAALRDAGERFGRLMGRNSARVFVVLTAVALGNSVGGATRVPSLPGFARASIWGQEVQSVAVSAGGTFTLSLTSSVVAMTARGPANATTTREEGLTRYRFNTGHAFTRVHKSGLDWRETDLSPDEVEQSIMAAVRAHRAQGGVLPEASRGAVPNPYIGRTTVRGHPVEFTAVQSADDTVFVGTYYLVP